MQRAMPMDAHAYGDTDSRKAPTLKASPLPVKSMSVASQFMSVFTSFRHSITSSPSIMDLENIQAPTISSADPVPPSPYVRLIVAAAVCV
jgi:hypothetical protein